MRCLYLLGFVVFGSCCGFVFVRVSSAVAEDAQKDQRGIAVPVAGVKGQM